MFKVYGTVWIWLIAVVEQAAANVPVLICHKMEVDYLYTYKYTLVTENVAITYRIDIMV